MLKAENLAVRYSEKTVLQGLSLTVGEGEWWAVVGPNGAGKSTLAGALGKNVPYTGSITLSGKEIREIAPQEYARKVGVLSQNHSAVYGFTVEEVVSLGRYARQTGFLRRGDPEGAEKIDAALKMTGLSEMRKRNMLTLSGGECQRVFLAQVFCQDPEILILDEPANHLDLPFQQELFSLIGLAEDAGPGGDHGDARSEPGAEIRHPRPSAGQGKMRRTGKSFRSADSGSAAERLRDGCIRLDQGAAEQLDLKNRKKARLLM